MKKSSIFLLLSLAILGCRSVRVKCDGPKHYVNLRQPKVKYPVSTDMVYSTNQLSHNKIFRSRHGRMFYYRTTESGRRIRVYLKIKR